MYAFLVRDKKSWQQSSCHALKCPCLHHAVPHAACQWFERSFHFVLPLPARYFHKGSLAYVGGDQAVMDIPKVGPILGKEAGVMWKGYETFAQVSESSAWQILSTDCVYL